MSTVTHESCSRRPLAGSLVKRAAKAPWRTAFQQAPVLLLALSLVAAGRRPAARGGDLRTEPQLIEVLQSSASPGEKDAACVELKRVGTPRCVPALAALLTDEQLADSARYVLESMSAPEASQALLQALDKTHGALKVGIIDSLEVRDETNAVPALAKALTDSDGAVASAAATALGRIGTGTALQALQSLSHPPAALRAAVVDALLRGANHLLAGGEPAQALVVFRQLAASSNPDWVQAAAFRGMVLASGDQGLDLACQAITGQPGPCQTAALQLVHELQVPGATSALAQLLPKVEAPVQAALVEGLSQRKDPVAAPAIAPLVGSASVEVRLAALNALGQLGDGRVIPVLARAAASTSGAEQAAAREALAVLRGDHMAEAFLSQLPNAKPAVQAELARALGTRGEHEAVPKLLELARQGSDASRRAAVQALAQVVDQAQLGSLVELVVQAKSEPARAQATEALNTACVHIQSQHGHVDVDPLLKGLAQGSAEARIALLPVCAGFNNPPVRTALRGAVAESNAAIRGAAIRALCTTTDPELLPDLVKLAVSAPEPNLRTLAVGGCVRLLTQEETVHFSDVQRAEAFKAILAGTPTIEQKQLVLAGLAEVPTPEALKLTEPMLQEAAVQGEAARTIIKIAPLLSDVGLAQTALKEVLAHVQDGSTRQAAEAALKQTQSGAGFITAWQVAGPFKQSGRDYRGLLELPLNVERPGMAQDVRWKPLACADAGHPWLMDLLQALGGQECVAYARTWIHCDQGQAARLELGSDDGLKVWFNRKVILVNNVARALKPGSDTAAINLEPGWNQLLLKVSQHNQGWGFCARLLKPDGSPLENVRFDAAAAHGPELN